MSEKKIYRAKQDDRMVAGVCSGLAAYVSVDPVIVRALFVCLALMNGIGVIIYIILAIITPEREEARSLVSSSSVFDKTHSTTTTSVDAGPKKNYKRLLSYAIIGVGTVLFIGEIVPEYWQVSRFVLPLLIIGIGLFFLFSNHSDTSV